MSESKVPSEIRSTGRRATGNEPVGKDNHELATRRNGQTGS